MIAVAAYISAVLALAAAACGHQALLPRLRRAPAFRARNRRRARTRDDAPTRQYECPAAPDQKERS